MGSRYNALHIAAKKNKPKICEFILNTVGDPNFMQWHYGEDKCKTYLNPAQIMQDLYLNTPDKGLNETPLHFAVKFGFKDVVRVLVSYSQCIKNSPNKYNQLPIDVRYITNIKHLMHLILFMILYYILTFDIYIYILFNRIFFMYFSSCIFFLKRSFSESSYVYMDIYYNILLLDNMPEKEARR